MTRRRWIADEISGDRAALLGEHANHLVRVLRARLGQDFDIATGRAVRRGKITFIQDDRVEFELGEEVGAAGLAEITLLLAVFKFDRMEWAIEKCTELGVSKIAPVIARRTDAHLASAAAKRVERWQRIAREAAEQSRRATTPEIAAPTKIAKSLHLSGARRIVLAESERQTLSNVVNSLSSNASIAMAVGPEGGWTDDELKLFDEAGWISASLGNTILRAETAAIAATAIVAAALYSL
jgi:16S rRNA (uracil1498-N3)-methyltransferase